MESEVVHSRLKTVFRKNKLEIDELRSLIKVLRMEIVPYTKMSIYTKDEVYAANEATRVCINIIKNRIIDLKEEAK